MTRESPTEREGWVVASQRLVTDRFLGVVQHAHGCDLDSLATSLHDLSWSQVFLEVDRLSRRGEVRVTFGTEGRYMTRLPDQKKKAATHSASP